MAFYCDRCKGVKKMKKTVTIRLTADLYNQLQEKAQKDGRTTSGYIELLINKGLEAENGRS
jgi:predicted DNA-binding protein